jgi:hypothetical protein
MALVWHYGEKSGHTTWKGLTWGMVSHIHFVKFKQMQILGEMVFLPVSFILNITAVFAQFTFFPC